ncbi:hypothetical protein [Streptomyces albogriseolus]|uniref:hypothetical protein n=1 Tax=Streptomyces albogriseolus TaxID=1887 RepID=UPI003D765528
MTRPSRGLAFTRGLAVAAVTAATISGCGSAGGGDDTTGSPERAPSVTELKQRLPLYALLYTHTTADVRVSEAKQRLIARCMAARGFRYQPPPVVKPQEATALYPAPFGLEPGRQAEPAPSESVPAERRESPAYMRALFGDPGKTISAAGATLKVTRPATGCQADAEQDLLGDGRVRWLELRIRLGDGEREARRVLDQSAQFRRAGTDWRACMRDAGYRYNDPEEVLRNLPSTTAAGEAPAARADLGCKESTDYLRTAYGTLAEAQRAWLSQNPKVAEEWRKLERRQARAARNVPA